MPAGRPTKLTPEVEGKICQALAAGNWREVAAEWAGVHASTFRRWMERGEREAKGLYHDFARRVREAEKQAEIRAVALVMQAAQEDPRHAEWWLERKHPDRWGRREVRAQVEHSGPGGGPLEVAVEHDLNDGLTTPERLAAVAGILSSLGLLVPGDAGEAPDSTEAAVD